MVVVVLLVQVILHQVEQQLRQLLAMDIDIMYLHETLVVSGGDIPGASVLIVGGGGGGASEVGGGGGAGAVYLMQNPLSSLPLELLA